MKYYYNPKPTHVWSRLQNQCTYITPNNDYTQVYIPLTNQTVTQAHANYETKMFYKGNILQYKCNSAQLTKNQKYSQLANRNGPSRKKNFATQTISYSNPNNSGLLRVGYTTYSFPNEIIGAPNNISGPFAYDVKNPNECSSNEVQDGGILICGTYSNQCSGEIYKKNNEPTNICNSSTASNVPGDSILCWNKKIKTWFPKPKYNNNSANKWPVNYKGFVKAGYCLV